MTDVLVAGAGPAGCIAAIVLARAGLRVRMFDRARFPRHKLCGDTLNPGALAILRRLGLDAAERGLPIHGMVVTGAGGVRVDAQYPPGATGRAIVRSDLDYAVLCAAANAGVEIEESVRVDGPVIDAARGAVVGLQVQGRAGERRAVRAPLVIAADGRESRVARAAGLAAHPARPRRWAVGAYFTDVDGVTDRGEMHIRPGCYIGVAPVPGGLTNVCVVTSDRQRLRRPAELLRDAVSGDAALADRFTSARLVAAPTMLGPLAVDCPVPGMPGLLLAGDAAGFIDPMTGDGLRFALRGAELAAFAAIHTLETGEPAPYARLAADRRREFVGKWRFNRALRLMAESSAAVRVAGYATRVSSWPVRRIVRYAGDLNAA